MAADAPLSLSFGPLSVRGCVARVDARALLANLERVRCSAKNAHVLAVVKADAYGHGARALAPLLERARVTRFGVATVEEGLELREAGVRGAILVLGGAAWWSAPALLVSGGLTPVFSSTEELLFLEDFARGRDVVIDAHVKIDTGMSRVGVRVGDEPSDDIAAFVDAARVCSHVRVTGACTHFANADLADPDLTRAQVDRFSVALAFVRARGLPVSVAHVSNSAATLELDDLTRRFAIETWVRPGLMLYGVSPFSDERHQQELSPVLSWTAPIVARKRVPPGTPVSYGSTWTAERETELAVLGVGYVDGYPRALSNVGEVLLEGMRAPIRGRVCMDLTVVDVTDVVQAHGEEACALGASVTLLGKDGDDEISAREVASWAGTIPYEILTRIGARVPRVVSSSSTSSTRDPS